MSDFLDFLQQRLAGGGFTTEDALASVLPLLRQVAAAHRAGQVAPLVGVEDLHVQGIQIWYEEKKAHPPTLQAGKIRELDRPSRAALEVVGTTQLTADVDQAEVSLANLQIGQRGTEIKQPVYLPGYVSWEHEIGHQDPLTDVYSLGLILASLTCGLDFTQPEDLAAFVRHRRNLFELNPGLHPVLAKAVVKMTELSRHRRPQELAALLHTLENYRDQEVDFEFDLARIKELKTADPKGKRELILTRLQQRLFEISRRNRLLHFHQTMHTVNLTWASVPLSFDLQSIRPEQILTWNASFARAIATGDPIPLNNYLRFEEALYLPSLLDEIRSESRRDQAEFGFAQLRLVLCFLRWSNLKEKPPERFDSPLVLLPVQLTKTKGVRDVYRLEPLSLEAEVNPILRHHLKQLYDVDLPEEVDLASTSLDSLHEFLVAKIQSSEPGITVEKIDRPRINLIHARARRRLDQYQRRLRLSGRGIRSLFDLDYSYERDNYHPLGLRLFQTRIRTPEAPLRPLLEDSPRPRTSMTPALDAGPDKERLLYTQTEEETNPYRWEFDLCNVTLGNFRYRKMSLVRDYGALLKNGAVDPNFDVLFSLEPRPVQPVQPEPPPLEESFPIVSCDPTQASAIGLARTGRDFIIQGPPGTGKSQTITNLIADYIMRGKRVLFVCEKRAALDVVFHRLHQTGLHQLCCLIHDSQADKKAFIMDLKQTYEGLVEAQEQKEAGADKARRQLLEAMKRDLEPLQRFHQAMRSEPAQAALPLRRLLQRALELHSHLPQLTPLEKEKLPPFSCWQENKEKLDRLLNTLEDILGEPVLAKHSLRFLSRRLLQEEHPLEFLSPRLETAEKLLEELASQLETLDLPQDQKDSPHKIQQLVDYASQVQYLAEGNQLSLLRPDSELARALDGRHQKYQAKAKELERARQTNQAWTTRLARAEVKLALEQARSFSQSFFAFLKPSWWRLRWLLNRCHDFAAHKIKPTWTQILENLHQEYELADALADLEGQARDQFGFPGSLAEFIGQLAETRNQAPQLTGPAQALHDRILKKPAAQQLIRQLLNCGPTLDRLRGELAKILDGPDLTWSQLRDELALIGESLDDLVDFLPCLKELAALPDSLAKLLQRWPLPPKEIEAALVQRSLEDIFRSDRSLGRFTGPVRAGHVARLELALDDFQEANAAAVRENVRRKFLEHVKISSLPHGQLNAEQKEFKVVYNRGRRELEHEFGKTMRFKSIRDLVAGPSRPIIQDLKPVWLMSPLSVSDALPLEGDLFDVVIFDEASQVTLEEAIPALFRARQVIVVGDEMQLPPTNFFSAKQADDEETLTLQDDRGETVEYDLSSNSFLNHAARTLPATMLGWHYRSRSESLISYSNAAFYQGKLLTVPEVSILPEHLSEIRARTGAAGFEQVANLLARPLSFHFLEHGLYQQRRNRTEAEYIAHLIKGLLLGDGISQERPLSIGIVAFSEAQQDEIEKALQELARQDPLFRDKLEAEWEREQDEQFVGLLVKNLENIQGDERDVVIISVCYGHGPNGKMLMNFGPINQSGGERRLNVAFSRAKQHMVVVSSIRHHDITNDYNDGARCLKNYLRYAEAMSAGNLAGAGRVLKEMLVQEDREPEAATTDIVIAELAAALRSRGYQVDLAIGQSHFLCDLAVRQAGDHRYRTGILVDTDAYYENANILEREVLRPKLLRAFGWQVVHVLTKDWHDNRDGILRWLEKGLAEGWPEALAATNQEVPAAPAEVPPASQMSPDKPAAAAKAPEPTTSPPTPSPASASWQRYLEYTEGTSHKFWEITVNNNEHTVRFGLIGTDGQGKTKTFGDSAAAQRDALRLVQEKINKGYVEKKQASGKK